MILTEPILNAQASRFFVTCYGAVSNHSIALPDVSLDQRNPREPENNYELAIVGEDRSFILSPRCHTCGGGVLYKRWNKRLLRDEFFAACTCMKSPPMTRPQAWQWWRTVQALIR